MNIHLTKTLGGLEQISSKLLCIDNDFGTLQKAPSGPAMATNPEVVTTGSSSTVGRSVTTGAAGKVTKTEVDGLWIGDITVDGVFGLLWV